MVARVVAGDSGFEGRADCWKFQTNDVWFTVGDSVSGKRTALRMDANSDNTNKFNS